MSKKKENKNVKSNIELCDVNVKEIDKRTQVDNEIIALKAENDALKAKASSVDDRLKDLEDQKLRLCAEMENIRRRSQKDVENAHKFGLEKFTQSLLPVLDSMEKAIEASKQSDNLKAVSEGVALTMKMLVDAMGKFGINQIHPEGEEFDPNKHEAMAMQPNAKMKDNQVMSVFQTGYELNNRVVRPARVLVVKNA